MTVSYTHLDVYKRQEVVPAGRAVFGGLDAGADVAASALAAKLLVHGELLPVGRGRDFADACSPNDQDGDVYKRQ